jgi:glycine/D-amino acid oxidase-like deaminating enzyme
MTPDRATAPSPWLAESPAPSPAEPLAGGAEADVAVVGAGYTGLSAALALRREGLSVAVLEAETAGFGASGRNAGHLTPTIGKDLPTLTRMYGRERVAALVRLQETAITHVERLIATHRIDCGYEAVGNVVAAVHPRQHANLDRAARAAADFGIPGELLEPAQMEARNLPRAFTRGYFEPHGGVLDPGRYVRALRAAALAAGAVLHESTRVTGIDQGSRPLVRTGRGQIRCRWVVLASNAYTPLLGLLPRSGMRIQVQLFRTEPLDAQQMAAVGWRGREGIYTAHEILESYRLTTDNRIVGGSKFIRAGFGSRIAREIDPGVCRSLVDLFRARFPELADVRVSDHWGGPIYLSLDFLPVVGRTGRERNLVHSLAYAGHGLAMASYAGEMIADLILERDGPGRALWDRWGLPMPPEPLRSAAFQLLTRMFSAIDRRADRSAPRRG